jgi:CRISPR-associated RAMP protein (TIGR02581 family)
VHKQLLNEARLDLDIRPRGPVLIKAGETGGIDPTHPDMEFVRTRGQVFLPGSSLKGVVRAHSERILRTMQPDADRNGRGACDPLARGASCSDRLERATLQSHEKYQQSCFVCRLFGSTAVASRVRFTDALPVNVDEVRVEERNGVAIDRVYGSVAVGPFNYEVATAGTFHTHIIFKNFTLAQLVVVALALRDLGDDRIALGFAKSRGMGSVAIDWRTLTIRYPLAALKQHTPTTADLLGIGALAGEQQIRDYGLTTSDRLALPDALGLKLTQDGWGSLQLETGQADQIIELFRTLVPHWQEELHRD